MVNLPDLWASAPSAAASLQQRAGGASAAPGPSWEWGWEELPSPGRCVSGANCVVRTHWLLGAVACGLSWDIRVLTSAVERHSPSEL